MKGQVSAGAQPQYSADFTVDSVVTGGYMVKNARGNRRKVAREHITVQPDRDDSAENILAHPESDLGVQTP